MPLNEVRIAALYDPANGRLGHRGAQSARHRQAVDDVAQGGETDDENARGFREGRELGHGLERLAEIRVKNACAG
jgi:hypothetical protein